MRRAPRVLILTGLFAFAMPGRLAAEWHLAPFLGYTFNGSTTLDDPEGGTERTHWHFGGAVALIGEGPLGVEGLFLRTPSFFQRENSGCDISSTCVTGSRTYVFMGNVVLATPRGWNRYGLRPYVSGGLGLLHASRTTVRNVIPINLNLLGMNVGGGAVGLLTDRLGLRFDLRYFRKIEGPDEGTLDPPVSITPTIRLRYWATSVGVVVRY